MDKRYKALRFEQLDRSAAPELPIGEVVRPGAGWLRAVREALGLPLREVASRIAVTVPAVRSLEKAEADDRITLASLRRVAAALGCDVVYVLIPHEGSFAALAEREARLQVAPHIEAAEHSMQLEAQGSHDTDEKIAREARRKARGQV